MTWTIEFHTEVFDDNQVQIAWREKGAERWAGWALLSAADAKNLAQRLEDCAQKSRGNSNDHSQ